MYKMVLSWKEFNVNLNAMEAWLRANTGDHFLGTEGVGAGSRTHEEGLHLHFSEEPSQDVKDEIQSHWDGIEADSEQASSYKSDADLAAEKAVMKTSAKAKLTALGFSDAEIAALIG